MRIDPIAIIRKYYDPDSELYHTLVKHGKQVAALAVSIADRHPYLDVDPEFIHEAALLHDIGMIYTRAEDIGCHGSLPYICHGYLGADLLRNEGLPRHALVAERHTGAGLSLEYIRSHNLPLPHRDMRPVSFEEQIICFADKFFSKTNMHKMKTLDEVRLQLSRYDDNGLAQFDKWVKLFM